ncbi:hypothetical protein ebA7160 [Aromatoleum aromaticum EbN1]|uniref:Uncharacterized protein n=1 Tax=Aromatoleum aromaticum (strain DSM 19018 / LMG 30748 / EbN1) TaxID=76114 RepID=Q5NXM8_AROAE|nr:hypothetical protein ebA7160 [Aromatoleum aromaticum EbN1]
MAAQGGHRRQPQRWDHRIRVAAAKSHRDGAPPGCDHLQPELDPIRAVVANPAHEAQRPGLGGIPAQCQRHPRRHTARHTRHRDDRVPTRTLVDHGPFDNARSVGSIAAHIPDRLQPDTHLHGISAGAPHLGAARRRHPALAHPPEQRQRLVRSQPDRQSRPFHAERLTVRRKPHRLLGRNARPEPFELRQKRTGDAVSGEIQQLVRQGRLAARHRHRRSARRLVDPECGRERQEWHARKLRRDCRLSEEIVRPHDFPGGQGFRLQRGERQETLELQRHVRCSGAGKRIPISVRIVAGDNEFASEAPQLARSRSAAHHRDQAGFLHQPQRSCAVDVRIAACPYSPVTHDRHHPLQTSGDLQQRDGQFGCRGVLAARQRQRRGEKPGLETFADIEHPRFELFDALEELRVADRQRRKCGEMGAQSFQVHDRVVGRLPIEPRNCRGDASRNGFGESHADGVPSKIPGILFKNHGAARLAPPPHPGTSTVRELRHDENGPR